MILILMTMLFIAMGWYGWGVLKGIADPKSDRYYLFDVARFEAEMVTHQLNGASRSETTEDLDRLLQALYAFRYAHTNLSKATNEGVPLLESDSELIDLIFRWQLGGERGLNEAELGLLSRVYERYQEIYNEYRTLFKGNYVRDEALTLILEIDAEVSELIKQWEQRE
jgi:hypothetical protein